MQNGVSTWRIVTPASSPVTIADGDGILADTSTGTITIIIMAVPVAGYRFSIEDYTKKFATNNLTIQPEVGGIINGVAGNQVYSEKGQSINLVYLNSILGWVDIGNDLYKQAKLQGRPGGQILVGGAEHAGDYLTLQANSRATNTATNPAIKFKYGNDGATTSATILQNGKIGVGIEVPLGLFHIKGLTPILALEHASVSPVVDENAWIFHADATTLKLRATKDDFGASNSFLETTRSGYTISSVTFPHGNVGIGAATLPNTKLDVIGTKLTSFIGTTFGTMLLIGNDQGNNEFCSFDFMSTETAKPIGRIGLEKTATGSKLHFGTSNLYSSGITTNVMTLDDDGKVGFGTVTPSAKVDIEVSASSAQGVLELYNTNGTERYTGIDFRGITSESYNKLAQITVLVTNGGSGFGAVIAGDLIFRTNNSASDIPTEKMRITSSGNIGINNSSPNRIVDIRGAGTADTTIIRTSLTSDPTNYFREFGRNNLTGYFDIRRGHGSTIPILDFVIDNSGKVGIGTEPDLPLSVYGTAAAPALASNVSGVATIRTDTVNSGIRLNFGGYAATPFAMWMQAQYNGSAYPIAINPLGGDVGIGTNAPKSALDITGSMLVSGTANAFGSASVNALLSLNTSLSPVAGNATILSLNSTLNPAAAGNMYGLSITLTSGANAVSTARLVTISNLIKGAGTITTLQGLYVAEQTAACSTSTGIYSNVPTGGSASNCGLRIAGGSVASSNYSIYSDSTCKSYLAGSLGIGTGSPATSIHIAKDATSYGETDAQLTISGVSPSSKKLVIGYNTTGNYAFFESANYGSANTPIILNPTGGSTVGIGTTTPKSSLEIIGPANPSATTYGSLVVTNNNSGLYQFVAMDFRGSGMSYPMARISVEKDSTGSFMHFGTSNVYASGITTDAMVINPDGKIGIGIAVPTSKVHIYDAASADFYIDSNAIANFTIGRYSTDTLSPNMISQKSRGSYASQTAVVSGDFITRYIARAHDGSIYRNVTDILQAVEAYTAPDNLSGYFAFRTRQIGLGAGNPVERMRITGNGNIGIGTSTFGTNATTTVCIANGTAPASAPANSFQMYSSDYGATACPTFMNESGHVVQLFRGNHLGNPTDLATCIAWAANINLYLERLGLMATS